MWTFVKANLIGIIALVLFFVLLFSEINGCNNNPTSGGTDTLTRETIIKYDTMPVQYIPQYILVPTDSQAPVVLPPNYVPAGDFQALLKQYNELARKHLTTNTYNDSIPLKDSTGKQVGIVSIKDVISENQIKSRTPSYQLMFPHSYTTITLAKQYRQFYGGIAVTGTPAQIVNGGNVGLAYKDKKDKIYQFKVGAMQIQGNTAPYGEIGVFFPLGKKK